MLAVACEYDWPALQLDVQGAFVRLKKWRLITRHTVPWDKNIGVPMVTKLKKSLYGIEPPSRVCFETMNASSLQIGYRVRARLGRRKADIYCNNEAFLVRTQQGLEGGSIPQKRFFSFITIGTPVLLPNNVA